MLNIAMAVVGMLTTPISESFASGKYVDTDTISSHVIHFKHNSSVVDSGYIDNNRTLKALALMLNDREFTKRIKSIEVSGSTSPDGVYEKNMRLAMKRSQAVKGYLVWKYPHLDQYSIHLHNKGENWEGMLRAVENDTGVPYREKVMEVIRQDVNPGTKKWRLRQIGNGAAWEYIEKNILRSLRSVAADIVIIAEKEKTEDNDVTTLTADAAVADGKTEMTATGNNVTGTEYGKTEGEIKTDDQNLINEKDIPEKKIPRTLFAVKTNAVGYAFGVANVAVEVPFAKKFSFDFPYYFSPYTVARNYRFRILGFQPELKYWFDKPFSKHAVGIYGIGVMYNISVGKDRFQNTNGEHLNYGGGISYGYTIGLTKNLKMEFTAGLGYLHLDHDVFYNVENGALYDNRKMHYWGPTKLGVNIIYLFKK